MHILWRSHLLTKAGKLAVALAPFILAAAAMPTANATVTYSYTGSAFNNIYNPPLYTTSDSVTGSFTVPTALGANFSGYIASLFPSATFSFTDGVNTLTQATSGEQSGDPITYVATDASGNITQWDFVLDVINGSGTERYIDTVNCCYSTPNQTDEGGTVVPGYPGGVQGGALYGSPGTWSESTTTPEPASWGLVTFTLLVFGIRARKSDARTSRSR